MFSRLIQILLVATSLAPILLLKGCTRISDGWLAYTPWLGTAGGLVVVCLLLLLAARRYLERVPITITSVKAADQEVLTFLLTYMLPLLAVEQQQIYSGLSLIVFGIIVAVVVYNSHLYHVNPLLSMLGFHFYEVTASDNCSYILITRRGMAGAKAIGGVARISDHMIMEVLRDAC